MDEFEFEGDVLKVSKRGKVQKKRALPRLLR
jgi:hypothetical protein